MRDHELLDDVPILAGISTASRDAIARRLRPRSLHAGEVLFEKDDPADSLFLVRRGRLRILLPGEDGLQAVREVGAGAAIGELALLTGAPRSATVEAVRDSELLELDAAAFDEAMHDDPSLAAALARELARQLQATTGTPLPASLPSVLTLRALGAGADVPRLAAELAEQLGHYGRVASVDAASSAPDDRAAALDAAERDARWVLLLDDGGDAVWADFAERQCDRLIAVAAPRATDAGRARPGCDLLVDAPLPQPALTALLDALGPHAIYQIDAVGGRAAALARAARRLAGRSLGVVLSGGGARGFAHIGALQALHEAGFEIDRVGGCSMGGLIAALEATTASPDAIRDLCHEEIVRRPPFNDYTVPRRSLIRSRKAERMLRRVFGDTRIEELSRPLFTVSADLLSSTLIVHRTGPIWEAVGTSMAIPGYAPPVPRLGRLLVDGGVLNNLPVDTMAEVSEGPIVAVDVIRRVDVSAEAAARVPSIGEILARATVLGSVERAGRNRRLATLVIAPDVQHVALRDFAQLDRAVAAGRAAAAAALEAGGGETLRAALT